MTDLMELKRQFLEYLEIERGRSVKTVENYDRYLERFFDFAKVKKTNDLTEKQVRDFRLYLNRNRFFEVCAHKDDPRLRFGGSECHFHILTAEKTPAG